LEFLFSYRYEQFYEYANDLEQCRGSSLYEAPNYNNWPSILWRPFFSRRVVVTFAINNFLTTFSGDILRSYFSGRLKQQPSSVIHLHAPRNFLPYFKWSPWAYV